MELQKVVDLLREATKDQDRSNLGEASKDAFYYEDKVANIDNYTIKLAEQVGGEGEGDHYHIVLSIRDNNTDEMTYAKFDGYYNSWDGSEMDDEPYLVQPKQKTITVFETIK